MDRRMEFRKISPIQVGMICGLLALSLLIYFFKGKAQPAPVSPFGMNAHLSLRYAANQKNMIDAADKLKKAGVTWSREEFLWYAIDPDPQGPLTNPIWQQAGQFDYITGMKLLADRQVNVLGLLTYGPNSDVKTGMVYGDKDCPQADPNTALIDDWLPEWEEYVRAVVEKFGDQIDVWEIQNEQNGICFWRKVDKSAEYPNATNYVKVLKSAFEVIKAADPNDRVILGGLCPNSMQPDSQCYDYYEYTKMVADAGGWPYFDILAFHPYRSPSPPEEVRPRSAYNVETLAFNNQAYPYNLMEEIGQFRKLMEHWDQKPLWITELGYSTYSLEQRAKERADACGQGQSCCLVQEKTDSETVQADYLVRSYIQALAAGVENIMWYDFRDDHNVPSDMPDDEVVQNYKVTPSPDKIAEFRRESNMGIIRFFYNEKKSYHAFGVMSHLLEGSQFIAQVRGQDDRWSSGSDIHEYRFERGDETIIALWKSRGGDQCRPVQVRQIFSDQATQYGPNFSLNTRAPSVELPVIDGTVSLELTERPVFLVYHGGQVLGSQATPSLPAPSSTGYPWIIPTPPADLTSKLDQFLKDPLGWLVKTLGLPTKEDLDQYLLKLIQLALIKLISYIDNAFNQCLGGLAVVGFSLAYARRSKVKNSRP